MPKQGKLSHVLQKYMYTFARRKIPCDVHALVKAYHCFTKNYPTCTSVTQVHEPMQSSYENGCQKRGYRPELTQMIKSLRSHLHVSEFDKTKSNTLRVTLHVL